jgi:putative SOS response-associated peptidase YedK
VWRRGEPEELRTCTIITTAANERISAIHDRMPVILPPDQESRWLDPEAAAGELRGLLVGLPAEQTTVRAVGPAVNDVRHDGPECVLDPPPPAQDTLFAV